MKNLFTALFLALFSCHLMSLALFNGNTEEINDLRLAHAALASELDQLKQDLLASKDALQPRYAWVQVKENSWQDQLTVDNKNVSICPVCNQIINYHVKRGDIGNILAHLVKSHGAEFHSQMSQQPYRKFNFKYRPDELKEIDEKNFSAINVQFDKKNKIVEHNWKHPVTQAIATFHCNVCSKSFDFRDQKRLQKAKEHLQTHDVEILASCGELLVYVFENLKALEVRSCILDASFAKLNQEFVGIPDGNLPGGVRIDFFEVTKHPVTQELLEAVMGSVPKGNQPCPLCPVTYVTPEIVRQFLSKLNAVASNKKSKYNYKMPNDNQLHYMNRGDRTGNNKDEFSNGITRKNAREHITFNSSTSGIQPVGKKLPNKFGIELGNVFQLHENSVELMSNSFGYALRGMSWDTTSETLFSPDSTYFSWEKKDTGFSIVRTLKD